MALRSNDAPDAGAAKMKLDKRFRMFAQDFYCPLICGGEYGLGGENAFQFQPAVISEVSEASGIAPASPKSVHDYVVVSDSSISPNVTVDISENYDEADNARSPTIGHIVEPAPLNDTKTSDVTTTVETEFVNDAKTEDVTTATAVQTELMNDTKTDDVITAVDAPPTSILLSYLRLEPIKIPSSNPVEMIDSCTNTSQPLFADIAVGNSQPEMMDVSTEMSQKNVSTIDFGIQTSQELLFQAISSNITAEQKKEASTSENKKSPIVFPRVRCQTTGAEIPAKVPRLSELDQCKVNLNPIYSSTVTFEFNDEESDKENDPSILRQRGNVRNLMTKESTFLCPSKTQEPDAENDENIPQVYSSSSSATSSRGPFIRVGLSKKRRVPKPLHPRTFDWE